MKEIPEIADAIEFRAWAKAEPYQSAVLKQELKAALDDDDYSDELVEGVLDEIEERQRILGDAYPFDFDGDILAPRGDSKSTYLFCLGLTLLPSGLVNQEQRCEQFETVAMRAASGFFGGKAIRIGAPWRSDEILDYGTLLDKVVELIPDLGKRLRDAAPEGGDAGWDVLVVKSFSDGKFPRFIALGNCATGRTDWKRKGREREPGFFWSFFEHTHRSTFITFFAVPFIMDEEWRLSKSSDSTITFDRYRICEQAPESSNDSAMWLDSVREAALAIALN
jgi:hypothetical protein